VPATETFTITEDDLEVRADLYARLVEADPCMANPAVLAAAVLEVVQEHRTGRLGAVLAWRAHPQHGDEGAGTVEDPQALLAVVAAMLLGPQPLTAHRVNVIRDAFDMHHQACARDAERDRSARRRGKTGPSLTVPKRIDAIGPPPTGMSVMAAARWYRAEILARWNVHVTLEAVQMALRRQS
jgi:hypothetical protein